MIERSTHLNALGVVHGFTTRAGGVSQGRYATLNLGAKWGDDPQAVRTNLRRVGDEAGFDPDQLRLVRQVHGADVVRATQIGPESTADALWAHRDDPAVVVGVLTADCVPVLLADRRGRAVCAIHSGWRGTVAGITLAAVRTLAEQAGIEPAELVAAIGPCIELDAFEVGPEVAEQFDPAFVRTRGYARPHVDLLGVVRAQLTSAGVPAEHIERVGACTHANPDRYYSYRRDGEGIGQMLSFIAPVR